MAMLFCKKRLLSTLHLLQSGKPVPRSLAEEDGSFHFEVVSRSAIVMDGFVVLQKQAIRDGHMRGMVDHAVLQTFTDQMIYHHRPAIVQNLMPVIDGGRSPYGMPSRSRHPRKGV